MSCRFLPFAHLGLLLTGLLVALPLAHAQTAAQRRHDFDDALALAVAGDFTGCEHILFQGSPLPAQSLPKRVESATKLIHLALALRNLNQTGQAASAAQRALAILNESTAPRFAHAPIVYRGKVYELTGFIHERLFSDLASAKIAYGQALRENAASPAQAALSRIADKETKAARVQAKKRK